MCVYVCVCVWGYFSQSGRQAKKSKQNVVSFFNLSLIPELDVARGAGHSRTREGDFCIFASLLILLPLLARFKKGVQLGMQYDIDKDKDKQDKDIENRNCDITSRNSCISASLLIL